MTARVCARMSSDGGAHRVGRRPGEGVVRTARRSAGDVDEVAGTLEVRIPAARRRVAGQDLAVRHHISR